ncbi:MAG: cytochrome c biogenesis protein ResB [Phycisphaeraceae bacterium]
MMTRQPETSEPAQAPATEPTPATRWTAAAMAALASLKLTVVLMAMAMFIVLAGTLAQRELGIWAVMSHYFRVPIAWIDVGIFFPTSWNAHGGFPFPGGWLIGGAMLVNLLAAHVMRFQMTWKRSGILLIHSGLILLMLSEVVTGLAADEGQMTLNEGGWSNYVEDIRTVELAVMDTSISPTEDFEITIPRTFLTRSVRNGAAISHEWLPFDIGVARYMANAQIVGPIGDSARAKLPTVTMGAGLELTAMEQAEVSGADTSQSADTPAAYVTFIDRQTHQPIATLLTAVGLPPQELKLGTQTYQIALRFKRTYQPCLIQLLKFRHDVYIGTDIPKNFSSRVRLLDPSRHEDREVLIYMNHPLRYAGRTFYQAAFRGDTTSVLQVVDNPGWLVPYIACCMITGGLLLHFTLSLTRYVSRKIKVEAA